MITVLRALNYSQGRAYLTPAQVRRLRKKARREVQTLRPTAYLVETALALPIATAETPAQFQRALDEIYLYQSEQLAANLVTGAGQAMQ